jgi:hypothetical protein
MEGYYKRRGACEGLRRSWTPQGECPTIFEALLWLIEIPQAHSLDVTDLPTSRLSEEEGKPTIMDMMNTIQNLTQQIQASLTSVASMATPTLLKMAPLASSITKTVLSIKSISVQLETLKTPVGDFMLFPKLPIEIRLKIWREALPCPRVIDVVYDKFETISQEMKVLRTNQPPPMMLHVCHESRQETMMIYSQIGNVATVDGLTCSYTVLDLSRDTLFVQLPAGDPHADDQELLLSERLLTDETFKALKYLAIDTHLWTQHIVSYWFLTKFKSLLELTLVIHDIEGIGADHECWRMQPAQFELVEVEESRVHNSWKQEFSKAFGELKQEYPEWKEPKVIFKTVVRGGRQCCFMDEADR